MENLSLYRKYRPSKFTEIIGQDHVVDVLRSAIKNKKVSHSYIFSGGRGTGKTSLARLFADALKVDQNDIVEMDAASNRGIDDIRALRDGVRVLPFSSPYKIYIIDEAHMLTNEAWNALLKTIEEPPKHVIFIFATTEIGKFPETIISRCEVYKFKNPTVLDLERLVQDVAKKENLKMENGVSELVANLGEGSFRDTLSTLQKLIAYSSDNKITLKEAEKITGAPSSLFVRDLLNAYVKGENNVLAEKLEKAREGELDFTKLALLLVKQLRVMLVLSHNIKGLDMLKSEISEDDFDHIKSLVDEGIKLTPEKLSNAIECYENEKITNFPGVPLLVGLIK